MEIDSLETLLAHLISNTENRRLYYVACPISDIEIEFVLQATGLDLTGFRHIVENYALSHTLRKHGNPIIEAARGQIAVSPETFHFVPLIVSAYDIIAYELLKNRHTIIYQKVIGERLYCYVAEVRIGRKKQISARTLWIRKAKKPPA